LTECDIPFVALGAYESVDLLLARRSQPLGDEMVTPTGGVNKEIIATESMP